LPKKSPEHDLSETWTSCYWGREEASEFFSEFSVEYFLTYWTKDQRVEPRISSEPDETGSRVRA
jgi:hypothetical protein